MEPYRRSDDRVSERLPAYGVSDSRFTPSGMSTPGQRRGRSHVDDQPCWGADAGAGSEEVEQAGVPFAFSRAEAIVDTEILERVVRMDKLRTEALLASSARR